MEYDNTNTFVLFDNKDKQSEKHADKSGTINIDGTEYWLNGWNRNNGVIGGSVKLKETTGIQKAQDTYQRIKANVHKDTVITEISDEPIDLSEIPF